MNHYKIVFTFIFCLLFCNSSYATERVDPLKAFIKNFETLKADFVQTLMNQDGEELEKTSGILYLQQPGKFHWFYQQPYIQKIISNGEVLWVYDEDLEQVTIRELNNEMIEKTPAAIILGSSDLEKHFLQVDMGEIEGFEWIELTPRDIEAQYKNIRIGFDKRRLGMMIITDNLDQTTRIDFSQVDKNSDLTTELFNLEIPNDVDIIDERRVEQGLE